MSAMEKHGMKRLVIKEKDVFELELEKPCAAFVKNAPPSVQTQVLPHQKEIKEEASTEVPNGDTGFIVTSPMVGTFYASPSPDANPFIKVGDRVEEETVVCVIEAMKVMNEVKAGKSGTVTQVFVDHAHPVEFGTQLFRIV